MGSHRNSCLIFIWLVNNRMWVCFVKSWPGFVWTTERTKKQNEDWNVRLEQLKEYKTQHGDCLVPHGYKPDPSFAEWIHRQRTTFAMHVKEGRTNPMVEERMKKLEEMGFNFVRFQIVNGADGHL